MIRASRYRNVVVLTGAGVSRGSGLPVYRGEGGLWSDERTRRMSDARSLVEEPGNVWRFWADIAMKAKRARPNPAHRALARWEREVSGRGEFTLITQNVDGLHQRAGSHNVIELHGSLNRPRCSDGSCGGTLGSGDWAQEDASCQACGKPLRPAVTFFGEPIDALPEHQSKRALRKVDLFLAVGTSGVVDPAARFVRSARYAGARTVLVNLEAPEVREHGFDEVFLGPAEEILPSWFPAQA